MEKVINFIKSKTFMAVIIGLLGLAVLTGVFSLGQATGYRKAMFSYAWGENYHRNFAGPRGGFFNDVMGPPDFMDAHGTFGQVIKTDGPLIIVKGSDGIEKIVATDGSTDIRRLREPVLVGDIQPNENVIVLGEPNDFGQIQAKMIRVMPSSVAPIMMPTRIPVGN